MKYQIGETLYSKDNDEGRKVQIIGTTGEHYLYTIDEGTMVYARTEEDLEGVYKEL